MESYKRTLTSAPHPYPDGLGPDASQPPRLTPQGHDEARSIGKPELRVERERARWLPPRAASSAGSPPRPPPTSRTTSAPGPCRGRARRDPRPPARRAPPDARRARRAHAEPCDDRGRGSRVCGRRSRTIRRSRPSRRAPMKSRSPTMRPRRWPVAAMPPPSTTGEGGPAATPAVTVQVLNERGCSHERLPNLRARRTIQPVARFEGRRDLSMQMYRAARSLMSHARLPRPPGIVGPAPCPDPDGLEGSTRCTPGR